MSFDLQIISGDLVLKNGDLQTITDTNKLAQDILKICLTTAGSNQINPWYGSFLSRTLIGNPSPTGMIVQIAKSQLNTALTNLQQLQNLQVQSFQRVSADEQISAILNISVNQNNIDPTLYNVEITVLTKGLKTIPINFAINTI